MPLSFSPLSVVGAVLILPAVSLCAAVNLSVLVLYTEYLIDYEVLGVSGAKMMLFVTWVGLYSALLRSNSSLRALPIVAYSSRWSLVSIVLLTSVLCQIFFLFHLPVFAWDALGKWPLTGFAFYTKGLIASWNEVAPLWFEYESRHPMLAHFYAALSNSVSPISVPGLKAYLYNNISNILSALALVHYMIVRNRGTASHYLAVTVLLLASVPLYENHILAYGYIEPLQVLVLINTMVFGWLWIETRIRIYLFAFVNAAIIAGFIKLHSWMYVSIILAGFTVAVFDGFPIYRRKLTGITVAIYFLPPLVLCLLNDREFLSEIATMLFRHSTFSVMIVSATFMLCVLAHNQKSNVPVSKKVMGLVLVASVSSYPFWAFVFYQYLIGTTSNLMTSGSRVLLVCLCLQCASLVMALVGASKDRLKLVAA